MIISASFTRNTKSGFTIVNFSKMEPRKFSFYFFLVTKTLCKIFLYWRLTAMKNFMITKKSKVKCCNR